MNSNDSLYKLLYGNNAPSLPPTPPPQPQQSLASILNSLIPSQPKPPNSVLSSLPIAKPKPLVRIAQPQPVRLRIAKPKVFVSFDYENDAHYKRLLEAWSASTKFQFTFQDKTPQEIQSDAVDRVKAVLTTKVQQATHVLILVGKYANQVHPDAFKIGSTNWIHFECKQALAYKKKLVAVLLEPTNQVPSNVYGVQGIQVNSFNQAEIIAALSK